jgi:hypothetical protein
MSRTVKLILDVLIGAVVPIVVLSALSEPLGAVAAYLLAALIPVAWVAADLLLITRQFNVITSYTGLIALMRGLLAFWFVDGWQFALKDTAGGVVACLVLAGSLVARRPVITHFWRQGVQPSNPAREDAFGALIKEAPVRRALMRGTLLILVAMVVSSAANVALNVAIVTAPFGTDLFNQQVAQVNAITRVALNAVEWLAYGAAFWLLFRAVGAVFRATLRDGDAPDGEFWQAAEAWRRRTLAEDGP